MQTRLSKIASGIPLRQSSPASIERFLVEKVRDELGNFKDLATITPVIRVDSTDGDLSGNVTNGFGNVMLDVRGNKVHLPFIIHQKELIPFDEIRMGDQSVPYDQAKLQKIVNQLDKQGRVDNADGDDFGGIGEVVDGAKIPSGNGFLGTVMNIRDEQMGRGANGARTYEGPLFGVLDDQRLDRVASADVLDTFSDIVEKLAAVTVIPGNAVEEYLETLRKEAAEESQKAIDSTSAVKMEDMEIARVKRGLAKIDNEKLADVSRAASGNDIRFPIANGGMFEYRSGRVYHNIKPWAVNDTHYTVAPIKSIVIDNKNHYCFLRGDNKFMITLDAPPVFEFRTTKTDGLQIGNMYAMEMDTTSLSHPFTVRRRHSADATSEDYNAPISTSGYFMHGNDVSRVSSLFKDTIYCAEVMPAEDKDHYTTTRDFLIIIPHDEAITGIQHLDSKELQVWIQEHAKDITDAEVSKWMIDSWRKDFYLIPATHEFFRLEKAIEGYFTKPDGYFKEGPLVKQAAYEHMNQAKLVVEKDRMPRTYGIQWQFGQEASDGENPATQLQQRNLSGLSENQARQQLANLGYDNRRIELFFEIAKRNGREAHFPLPDAQKAQSVSPGDIGEQKSQSALKRIADSTLNAKNFMPVFEDVISDGLAGILGNVAPQSADAARAVQGWFKQSHDIAVEIEKLAASFGGATWHELAALLNAKHRLDKVAMDIVQGGYASGMEAVLEKTASLKPAISTHAKNLIDFNRQQLLRCDKALVPPRLVKQALHELDGLYRYASAHQELFPPEPKDEGTLMERLLKTAEEAVGKSQAPSDEFGAMPKEAGMFMGYNNMHGRELAQKIMADGGRALAKEEMPKYNKLISDIKAEMGDLQSKLREAHIQLRAHMNAGSPDIARKSGLESQIQGHENRLKYLQEKLQEHGVDQDAIRQALNNSNLGVAAAVGLPTILGASYGYEALKNQ